MKESLNEAAENTLSLPLARNQLFRSCERLRYDRFYTNPYARRANTGFNEYGCLHTDTGCDEHGRVANTNKLPGSGNSTSRDHVAYGRRFSSWHHLSI